MSGQAPTAHLPELSPEFEALVTHFLNARLQEVHLHNDAQIAAAKAREEDMQARITFLTEQLLARTEAASAQAAVTASSPTMTVALPTRRSPRRATAPATASALALTSTTARTPAPPRSDSMPLRSSPPASTSPGASSSSNKARHSAKPSSNRRKGTSEKGPPEKRQAQVYRLLKSDVPKEAEGVKQALTLIIHLLWGMISMKDLPELPDDDVVAKFLEVHRGKTTNDFLGLRKGPALVSPSLVQLVDIHRVTAASGTIAAWASRLEHNMIAYMQAACARFGVTKWRPDLRQSPYSPWNSALRILAIDIFKQLVAARGLDFFPIVSKYAHDTLFLIEVFDHVFDKQLIRYKRELRNPGVVVNAEINNSTYQARGRRARARVKFLKAERYPLRYIELVHDAKGTSDDERDPTTGKLHIKKVVGRSAAVTDFVRRLDAKRIETSERMSGRIHPDRNRIVPEVQTTSKFKMLPRKVPVDYFDPDFYNSLPLSLRVKITPKQLIALPDERAWVFASPRHRSEQMTDDDFMDEFGDALIAKYCIPGSDTAGDEGVTGDWLADSDEGGSDDDDDDDIEMSEGMPSDLEDQQRALAARMDVDSDADEDSEY